MKNRRFVAKCLTLAMVLALLIPAPVAAKSSGGKLPKSVTAYRYQTNTGRWLKDETVSYKYNKKNYPTRIETKSFGSYFLGVPMQASITVETAKYKFKGKTPKSMKLKNTAGVVIDTRKYKKGNLVSSTSKNQYSWTDEDDNGNVIGESTSSTTSTVTIKYSKKGLPTTSAVAYQSASSGSQPYSGVSNYAYTVTQKKGIPSEIKQFETSWVEGTASGTDSPDGTYTYTENGVTETGKDSDVSYNYAKFNKKGFVVEWGRLRVNVATQAATYVPYYKVQYKTKKGKVTQATLIDVDANSQTGVVTKETPSRMFKFKYTKKNASKARYFKMVNTEIGYDSYFNWY